MLLCSQDVVMSITSHQLIAHQLVLQPAGCIPLKGKRGEVKVYRPEADVNKHKEGVATKIVGRDTERAMLQTVLGGSNAETPTGSLGAVVALLEGRHGLGRSTLAEGLLQEVRSDKSRQATHAGMMFQCQRGDSPFVIWHSVLCWLLEQEGASDTEALAWLLVSWPAPGLPPAYMPAGRKATVLDVMYYSHA